MISLATGEFKLDDYGLVIRPNLTFAQFKAGDIQFSPSTPPLKSGNSFYYFTGFMDGLNFDFGIVFNHENIQRLFWTLPGSETISTDDLKLQLPNWLLKATQHSQPYEFEWGYIDPASFDIKGGDLYVLVMFKNAILNLGFRDTKSYYEYLRSELYYANLRQEAYKSKNPKI
jgi:hypothetical protein